MAISRREFIQVSAAGVGAIGLGTGPVGDMWGLTPNVAESPRTDGDRVVPTFCEICFWKCGVLAHVKDERITKIVGNPAHPLSRGRLCPRGTGGGGLAHDPDRLKHPLVRRKKGGQQVFEEVSWEAALDLVAERLEALRREHGPEALALFSHGYGASWFKHLVAAYGSGNITHPSYAQCRGAREAGFELTYGTPPGSPERIDLEHSRVITLIGSHLGENMHNTQVQDFARAIGRGAQLVVVDPRFSTAAGKARHWLPITPGTDNALLLAWMHVIIDEGLYDRDYVERYTTGFDALARHVADKTPTWAWEKTGLRPESIVETARFIAGGRPASLIHPGRRSAWYGDDTQRSRGIAILNALLGSYGRKGGFFWPSKMSLAKLPGIPKYSHQPKPPPDTPRGHVYPFANDVLAHGLRDASIPGTADYDIKAWLVYGTNLVQALPQPKKTIEAISKLDFMVAVDVLPMEITGWADVVLPEASYLERYDDLHAPAWKQGFTALRQPVVAPPGEAKPGWWIAQQIAQRLGLDDYFPWKDAEDYLTRRTEAAGLSFGDLKSHGVITQPTEPLYIEDGIEPEFDTPSGKIELYSAQMKEAGLSPMPDYRPKPKPASDQFRLLFGRAPTHTFGRTTNNRFLGEIMAENALWLNADVAKETGFAAGDRVVLVNQDDVRSGSIAVKPTQRIRRDCVYMVHGFGHDAPGLKFARGRGASDANLITTVAIDPAMGGTGMNTTFVRIERAPAISQSDDIGIADQSGMANQIEGRAT